MRKELARAVRAEFTAAMERRLPQFRPIKVVSRYAWPGSRVFEWRYDASQRFFVELFFSVKGADAFAVEVGWSRLGRYPEVGVRPGFPSGGRELAKPEHWTRVSSLYAPIGGFWSLEEPDDAPGASGQSGGLLSQTPVALEEALTRVERRVDDAVDKLVRYAIPYLEQVARVGAPSPAS